ncbi:MAG: hypothetical protein OEV42_19915 [Deltaproteobacteria bacterium]|nr:hypothetical protein [Deltaproteobacteria bacterium]
MKKLGVLILSGIIFLWGTSFATAGKGTLYTAYNLWYEYDRGGNLKPITGINYKRGIIIPAGTKVKGVKTSSGRRGTMVIDFEVAKDGKKYVIHYQPKYHPGVNIETFKKRLFTSKPLSALTKGFTKREKKNIKLGKVTTGMKKKAVLVAYGYPPEHKTESTKSNIWIYWLDRFRTMKVVFNDKGIVISE